MKKNILIITAHFAPENAVSAVRSTKLAKHLTRAGYEVTVLTAESAVHPDLSSKQDLTECGRVLRARRVRAWSVFSRLLRRPLMPRRTGARISSAVEHTPNFFRTDTERAGKGFFAGFLQFWQIRRSEQAFYRAALDYVQHAGLDLSHFDVMISMAFPLSSHMVALALRAKCPTIKWIADWRDFLEPESPAPLKGFVKKWQKRILSSCDFVTAASEGCLKSLLGNVPAKAGECIYNGFDPEDLTGIEASPEEKKAPFTILTGGVNSAGYEGACVVLRAISDLLKSGRIRRDQICVAYYGTNAVGKRLQETVDGMDLPPLFSNRGRVSRREFFALGLSAQALVLSVRESEESPGIIPARFADYLMIGKPIIGVALGKQSESETAHLIHQLRVGYCYRESLGEEAYEQLKKYIAESYTYWRTRKKELYEPDEKRLAAFDYTNLMRRWKEILEDL